MTIFSQSADKESVPQPSSDLDTVALVCLAIVPKTEYDEMLVKEIVPARVVGANGREIPIAPMLLVGTSKSVLDQAMQRLQRLWHTYDDRVAKAFKKRNGK